MEVLRTGFDSVYVAFQGTLGRVVMAKLDAAKSRAQANDEPELVTIGGVPVHVHPSGTGGGYAYKFDTGPCGETWLVKKSADPEQWNIFCEFRALGLASDGWYLSKDRALDHLERWQARILAESVNRVDFAIDLIMPADFRPDPVLLVCPAKSSVQEYSQEQIPRGGTEIFISRRARQVQTITVGKMPGRQVTVYDKRAEQMAAHKGTPWFEIWGYHKDDCPPIWRVELRAGKEHLKQWNIKTFADIEAAIGDVFKAAVAEIRFVSDASGSNISRAPVSEFWKVVQEACARDMARHEAGLCRGRVVAAKRSDMREMFTRQIAGLAATYSFIDRLDGAMAAPMTAERVAQMIRDAGRRRQFAQARKRAADRYIWLEEEGLQHA